MKHLLPLFLALCSLSWASPSTTPTPKPTSTTSPTHPNVIVILVDDLGYGDLTCYGANPKHFQTPNIDRLANEGLRWTDAHSPSSVCTPSRYSLLTGQYPFRNHMAWGILPGDAPLAIPTDAPTLPKLFLQAGYSTGFIGKWHLGLGNQKNLNWNHDIKPGPLEIGFQSAFFMPSTGDRVPTVLIRNHHVLHTDPSDPISVSYQNPIGSEPTGKNNPNAAHTLLGNRGHDGTITQGVSRIGWMSGGKQARWIDSQLMSQLTSESIQFISQNQHQPFFLYFAPHGIHEPRITAPEFVGKSGAGAYGDQILELDHSIGKILNSLDQLNLRDSTLILLSSDNGGSYQDLAAYQYGPRSNLNGHTINGKLRGEKYSLWEGGTRVPMLVRWPGTIPAGKSTSALFSLMDLYASFAEMLQIPTPTPPNSPTLDSQPLWNTLIGKSPTGRSELLEHQYQQTAALRQGPWKWTQNQLFNLDTDPSETTDLAPQNPTLANQLKTRLHSLLTTP